MAIIKRVIKLNKEEYYKRHLLIINNLLPEELKLVPLTNKEAEVLAAFMSLEGDISKDPFGTSGRKMVRNKLNLSAGGLGNYLEIFKNKLFLVEDNKELKIPPFIIPSHTAQEYQLRLEMI